MVQLFAGLHGLERERRGGRGILTEVGASAELRKWNTLSAADSMTRDEIIQILDANEVIMQGHFLLSSGLHSDYYVQCARIFEHPEAAALLCAQLTAQLNEVPIDIVLGPAIGAITMAYEMSRQLGVPNVFAEREHGVFRLRRGFSIPRDANVLLVEDVVTTGGSVHELDPIVADAGARVSAVASMIDRSHGSAHFDVPFFSVLTVDVSTYEPDGCPLCAEGIALDEPGSRRLR